MLSRRQRFALPAGQTRTITIRFTAAGYRHLTRHKGGVVALEADGLAADTPAFNVLA